MIFLFDPVPLSELIFKGIRRFLLAGQVKLDRHVRTFCSPQSGLSPVVTGKKTLPDIVVSAELLICFVSCSPLPSYLEQR
jgi:hypothetical protein